MATLLKDIYNPAYFERICPVLKHSIPGFNCRDFIFRIFNNDWPDKELKERVRHITTVLHHFLDDDFRCAAAQIVTLSRMLLSNSRPQSFENIFLPDYIQVYGLSHPEESLQALGEITKLVSAEFAVRPFIESHPQLALAYLSVWSKSEHASVRRLASEGPRPRLPWASVLSSFKEDPTPLFPILEQLKEDTSEYVRKSVANCINDIAKDHPDLILQLARKWRGKHPHTDWIIRHGCRSLLKKGHIDALSLHGFNHESRARIQQLLLAPKVKIGDHLDFKFAFVSKEKEPVYFRLEYAIDYLTSTGKTSRKIFKLSENLFPPGEGVTIRRKQSFRNFTTRKHFCRNSPAEHPGKRKKTRHS